MLTAQAPLLVDVKEAARLIGCSRSTIYELIAAGQLRGVKIGRSRRFTLSELEAFVAERMQAAATDVG